ncbi:sugar phosphate isomerase/epimerase family protein [Microbacterium sp. NPDC076911]|uniref:sugar phosphate isomerase/epimerase family protein n=1 Tax=Microbacterium sp. NPDC076911 TaxID=3154958 RepID=UPI00343176D3
MMKLSFSTRGSPEYTIDQIIEIASANGYDGVELRAAQGTVDLTTLAAFSDREVAQTREKFEDAGIAVACLGSSVHINGRAGDALDDQIETAKTSFDLAARLGAGLVRVFAGPPPEHPRPESTYGEVADGLAQLAQLAEQCEVTVAVETHGTLSKARALAAVLSQGVPETVRVIWDVMHTVRAREQPSDSYALLQPLIAHVHLRDAVSAGPAHDYVLTGEGTMPIASVVTMLQSSGFDGFFSFEWEKFWHPEIAEPETAIPQFARYMRKLES